MPQGSAAALPAIISVMAITQATQAFEWRDVIRFMALGPDGSASCTKVA